jgi:hypothetical protein
MAIHLNTEIHGLSLIVVAAESVLYESRILNSGPENMPEDIWNCEKPGMCTIQLWGVKFENEHPRIAFVNDLSEEGA